MSEDHAPRRLLDDPTADAELRSLLLVAQRDQPSDAQLARLASRIGPLVGLPVEMLHGPPPATSIPPAAPLAATSGSGAAAVAKLGWAKLSAAAVPKWISAVLLAGAGSWYWLAAQDSTPSSRAPVAPSATSAAELDRPHNPPARAGEPQSPARQAQPRLTDHAHTGSLLPREPEAARALSPSSTEAVPRRAAPNAPASSSRAARAQIEQESGGVGPRARVRVLGTRHVAAPVDELQLIREAQALRGRHRRVLASVQRHAALYPRGALAQEREVLAIEALFGLGRRGEARARLDAFVRRYPGSAHLPQLDRLRTQQAPD